MGLGADVVEQRRVPFGRREQLRYHVILVQVLLQRAADAWPRQARLIPGGHDDG